MKNFIEFIRDELSAGQHSYDIVKYKIITFAIQVLATIRTATLLILPIMLVSFVLYNYWTQ